MDEQIENYVNYLVSCVVVKIDEDINEISIKILVENELSRHINNYRENGFHNYYFQIIGNEKKMLTTPDFFRVFKSQYSLQGIDSECLGNLENRKREMLNLIKQNKIFELYAKYFAGVEIKHKNKIVKRNLGSFFAKFVHTFRPEDYCALDNPIKNYFGLKNESFLIAFFAISKAYKVWAQKEKNLVNSIRREFKELDKENRFELDKMSDLKFLDLIFWTKANIKPSFRRRR